MFDSARSVFNPILRGGDVLIRGGSKYTHNLSFVIAEHIKLVPGQKKIPTACESPPKSAG